MEAGTNGKVSGATPCAILDHDKIHDKNNYDSAISPEEAEFIDLLAQILVNDMLRLEDEYGLRPAQMVEYYKGHLTLEKRKGDKT